MCSRAHHWDVGGAAAQFSGLTDPAFGAQFGIADYDFSGQKAFWANDKPMDVGGRLLRQARLTKAINPHTKVFSYRNYVKALSWFKPVGEKLADPAYAGWFVRFTNGSLYYNSVGGCPLSSRTGDGLPYCSATRLPKNCTGRNCLGASCKCDTSCDCGGAPCGQYLFDHRNASLRRWLADVHSVEGDGVGDPAIARDGASSARTPALAVCCAA